MRNQHEKKNYVGQKFGSLTIIKQYIKEDNKTYVDIVCDCGTKSTRKLTLVVNRLKSCKKCQRRGRNTRLSYGEASFNTLYKQYINNAKARGRTFSLTKEQAKILHQQNCFYCGNPPQLVKQLKRSFGEFVYNGLDRKDNTQGYTVENCVTCCKFCNFTKGTIPFSEFIKWIRQVYKTTEHFRLRNGAWDFVKV